MNDIRLVSLITNLNKSEDEMSFSNQAAIALSKAQWLELDQLCEKWSRQEPQSPVPHALQELAWLFMNPPQLEAALEKMDPFLEPGSKKVPKVLEWSEGFRADQEITDTPLFQAFIALFEGIREDSYEQLDKQILKFPDSAELLFLRGMFSKGHHIQVSFIEKAVAISPSLPVALIMLAGHYKSLGRRRESVSLLMRFIENSPGSVEGHVALGHAALDSGQYRAAAFHFRKVLALGPKKEIAAAAREVLDRRLAGIFIPDSEVRTSTGSPIDLEAIPQQERALPVARPGKLSNARLYLYTLLLILLLSGPISSGTGYPITSVGIWVGIIAYLTLWFLFGSRS